MKNDFAAKASPIKIDGNKAHAFVFGEGRLDPSSIRFTSPSTGISNDLEGPDYTEWNLEDQFLAAQKMADSMEKPCAIVMVLDEARASWSPVAAANDINSAVAASQQGPLRRGLNAGVSLLRRAIG